MEGFVKSNPPQQGLGHIIIHGILAGGLAAGIVGGLWVAINCYLGRLDPEFYPNRSLLVLCFTFALGFMFSIVPGIVLGIIGSLIVFYLPRRKPSVPVSEDALGQDNWPPAPMNVEGDEK